MVYCARVIFLVLFATSFLSACGHKTEENGSQVVARVNGDEITAYQLANAMAHIGNIPKGKEAEAEKQILRSLVDQQILVKLAVDNKLDRNPNVLLALEASQRQILMQASLDQLIKKVTKPTNSEIHDYYIKSPELFANRRVYKFAEFSVDGASQRDKVKSLLSNTKNLEEFARKLHKENIDFKSATVVKAAEELPTVLLPKFSRMAKGEVAIIPVGDNLSVLQLQDFKDQPLTEDQAKPFIGKFLFEQKRKTLIEGELKRLQEASKIEYFGAYADANKSTQETSSSQTSLAQSVPTTKAASSMDIGKVNDAKDSPMAKELSGPK